MSLIKNQQTLVLALGIGLFFSASGNACADNEILGGRPRMGVEFEYEESPNGNEQAVAVTLIPGVQWKEGWINRAEILVEDERNRTKEAGDTHYGNAQKYGIRLRKNFQLSQSVEGHVRGLVGRAVTENDQYYYAYVEPALTYKFTQVEWTASYRFVRAIDGTDGHDTNKLRIGPSFDLDDHQELEFRWARAWNAHNHTHESDALIVEYVYKF